MMKSEADQIADETERLLQEIRLLPASKFTVGEVIWVHQLSMNLRWATTVEFEERIQAVVRELLQKANSI